MYIILHSTDPYLLARMATDLQMEGFFKRLHDSDYFTPFCNGFEFMYIGDDPKQKNFDYGSHDGVGNPERIDITKSNYIETLSLILNSKDK